MFSRAAFRSALFLLFVSLPTFLFAEDPPSKDVAEVRKKQLREWMQNYAETTEIRIVVKDEREKAELVPQPVFRYSDDEREIPDATLWVWTRNARPAAFQKVEVNSWRDTRQWTVCFASLSENLLEVNFPQERKYKSKVPGVEFRPIPEAEPPSDKARQRTSQIKSLKERFTGTIASDGTRPVSFRAMPRPIFEYSDPDSKLPLGAIFGLTSTGTNPDILLIVELRKDDSDTLRWEYALARMTSVAFKVKLDDHVVWEGPGVPRDPPPDNWLYFFLPRDIPDPAEKL